MKAQEANDSSTANSLLETLVLPNPGEWYARNFDRAASTESKYEADVKSLPIQLAQFFVTMHSQNQKQIIAVKFDKTCDDDAGDQTAGVLDSRLLHFPLYELRFFDGNRFSRLFAFVYVDGAFRFVVPPDPDRPMPPATSSEPEDGTTGAHSGASNQLERVTRGGNLQAAKLIHRVAPEYPEKARAERLQGTVRLHAIIAKDGTIRALRVVRGVCSLAKASIDAVKQWRYSPTMIQGTPVEVDTTIDVTFSLRY